MNAQAVSDADLQVLSEMLRRDVITAQYIRDELGHDPLALNICLKQLTAMGCEIEVVGAGAYRLICTGLEIWEDYLNYTCRFTSLKVDRVRVFRETASTQDLAKESAPQQVLVLSDHQTAGRGRLGRSWQSEPGACVLMSLVKRITGQPSTHDRISMTTGVAVAQAVQQLCPDATVGLKWPNDVIVGGRKLAGILIEAAAGTHIIGIGLNVHRPAQCEETLKSLVISLSDLGPAMDRLRVIEEVLAQIGHTLRQADTPGLLDEWRARATLGQTQTFEHAGQQITGQVLDLDPDHGLIVRRDTGEIITLPAATTSVVK